MSMYLIIGMVTLYTIYAVIVVRNAKKKRGAQETIFASKKRTMIDPVVFNSVFLKLYKFPVTHQYVVNLQKMLDPLYPGDRVMIRKLVVCITLAVYLAGSGILVAALAIHPTVYVIVCCVIIIYVLNKEITATVIEHAETTIYSELDRFMELVQFQFMQTHSVEDALHDSICGKNKVVERHARKILKVLNSDDLERDLDNYMYSVSNGFLKELMCICVTTFTYGDTEIDGESCFLRNLRNLKQRVADEVSIRNEIHYRFSGTVGLVPPALFAAVYMKDWAMKNVSDLEPYFKGYYGFISEIAITVATVACYVILNRLKSRGSVDLSTHAFLERVSKLPFAKRALTSYYNRNYGQYLQCQKMLKSVGSKLTVYTLAVKRVLCAIGAVVVSLILVVGMNISVKQRVVSEVTGNGSKSTLSSEEVKLATLMIIRSFTDEYLQRNVLAEYRESTGLHASSYDEAVQEWMTTEILERLDNTGVIITDEQAWNVAMQYNSENSEGTRLYVAYLGSNDGPIREENESMYTSGLEQLKRIQEDAQKPGYLDLDILKSRVAEDVFTAVRSYNEAYLHWWQLLIVLCVGIGGFYVPYLWLKLNKAVTQQMMEQEVMQFHSLVMALRSVDSMSVEVILDWLLKFAVIFRPGIHKCIVNFPADEEKAFEDLMKSEPFEPFQNLVRNLQMCDNVGVQKAFMSLDVTQKMYIEHNKQITVQRINTNATIASLVMFLPYLMIITLYLCYPLMVESMGQYTEALSEL